MTILIMARKKQISKKQKKETPKGVDDKALVKARKAIKPSVHAAIAIAEYDRYYGEFDMLAMIDALEEQTSKVNHDDLRQAEAMLTAQAHTLDAIFNNLARKAIKAEYIKQLDGCLKLALRAQSQCRSTWEAVAKIKNPPVLGFIGQANIAQGPQQVNNAPANQEEVSCAGENRKPQNKLLEENDGKRVDTGEARASGQADPEMATMGKVNRAKKRGR